MFEKSRLYVLSLKYCFSFLFIRELTVERNYLYRVYECSCACESVIGHAMTKLTASNETNVLQKLHRKHEQFPVIYVKIIALVRLKFFQ